MNRIKLVFLGIFISVVSVVKAQDNNLKWWNPLDNPELAIEGQAWTGETKAPYDRLPARAEENVRKEVWDLSRNSSGITIRFKSNSKKIVVEYGVTGGFSFTHMPATSVSGVDLYAVDSTGKWMWCAGQRSFGDTVRYVFQGIKPSDNYLNDGIEYKLYLPLYNSVKWLRIGVPQESFITTLPKEDKKPIVVYGSSIAQGACTSRSGLVWTALVGREFNLPVINLGFSGNGKLEKEILELIGEIDAEVYILDCFPNMTAPRFTEEEVKNKIIDAVKYLQTVHSSTPILISAHDGYTDGDMRPGRFKNYNDINIVAEKTFKQMKADGFQNIYFIPYSEIGMDIDSQVDGIHPNDWGMHKYADAYTKYLKVILGQ